MPQNNDTPFASDDRQAIKNACKKFHDDYQPILTRLDIHLEQMIRSTKPPYAQAYQPWLKSLREIGKGILLMSKGIPLPDPAALIDALKMFCFDSTLQFLSDLCITCKLALKTDWITQFRKDIDTMLFAVAALQRAQQNGKPR